MRDCRIADIARRIRYAADMVGDDELPGQLHALARELEAILVWRCIIEHVRIEFATETTADDYQQMHNAAIRKRRGKNQ